MADASDKALQKQKKGKVTLALRLEAFPVNYTPSEWRTLFSRVARLSAAYGNALIREDVLNPDAKHWDIVTKVSNQTAPEEQAPFRDLLPDAVRSVFYHSEARAKRRAIREALRGRASFPSFKPTRVAVRDRVWKFLDDGSGKIRCGCPS
ncbi:MAG: hypothetical protein NZ951_04945 [Dehalococcoidia bacterium]|nr:hypothetical protein [Dehalococcoidia bacterium]MDW8120643.1 hypothetical protein [Chloroflexota bacterium]